MGLSVFSKNCTIRINYRNGIKRSISCLFKKAHRNHNIQFFCHLLKTLHSRILLQCCGKIHIFKIMSLAKIRCLKKLLQKNDIRSFCSCLPYQFFCFRKCRLSVPAARHLRSCYYNFPHNPPSPFCFFIHSNNPLLHCPTLQILSLAFYS